MSHQNTAKQLDLLDWHEPEPQSEVTPALRLAGYNNVLTYVLPANTNAPITNKPIVIIEPYVAPVKVVYGADIADIRFGHLTAVKLLGSENRCVLWLFRCDCGTEKPLAKHNVVNGGTRTCGAKSCSYAVGLKNAQKLKRATKMP